MKIKCNCVWCGKELELNPSLKKERNFCSKECFCKFRSKAYNPEGYKFYDFSKVSKHMTELNKKLNPTRMTPEVRAKLRKSRLNTGKGVSYKKLFGRHEHRVVAEKILGRKLKPGEIVHHIDGNKRNNDPSNLIIFRNQAEHLEWHRKFDKRYAKGGGAE